MTIFPIIHFMQCVKPVYNRSYHPYILATKKHALHEGLRIIAANQTAMIHTDVLK